MKRAIAIALGVATIVSSAAAIGIGMAAVSPPESLGRDHYVAARAGLESAAASSTAECERRDAAMRELCRAEIAAYQMVRAAELDNAYKRTRSSARTVQRARIEARYQIERAKCTMAGGARRDACFIKAHTARGRALLDAAMPYADTSAIS